MVTEKRQKELKQLNELIQKHPVIGLIDLAKMPSRQFQFIRKNLRGTAEIKMFKKGLMERAIEEGGKKNLEKFNEHECNEPALIFANVNPFKLYRLLEDNRSSTYAKENDVAPEDIVIHAGPTKLPAGPAIGELQRVKLPAMVKEGKIHVSKDTVLVKKGGVITAEIANVLKKLGMQPMKIGINLLAVWENEMMFDKGVLAVSREDYFRRLQEGYLSALNLAVGIEYITKYVVKLLIQKAYLHAKSVEAGLNIAVSEEKPVEKELPKEDGEKSE